MHTICHFEIPAEDMERAKRFYSELFGWKIEGFPGYQDYWGITTSEEKGAVPGGMMKRQAPEQQIMVYVDVESVDEATAKLVGLGGKVVMAKTAVPKMGWFAVCLDTENNALGLWECDEGAK